MAIHERPILMSTDMVKAILEGRKTMTRRVMKPQPDNELTMYSLNGAINWRDELLNLDEYPYGNYTGCPYGQVGDRLWVRETWDDMVCLASTEKGKGKGESNPLYKASADSTELKIMQGHWKPSIFMPRWASRITLEITGVRVERLQEIDSWDCIYEGIHQKFFNPQYNIVTDKPNSKLILDFHTLWDSINAKLGFGWDTNCFVWVIEFK